MGRDIHWLQRFIILTKCNFTLRLVCKWLTYVSTYIFDWQSLIDLTSHLVAVFKCANQFFQCNFFSVCLCVTWCPLAYIPTASSARFLLSGGPVKKREFTIDFIRSVRNSLVGPPLSMAPSPRPQVSTKTTSIFSFGSNFARRKALIALPNTSVLRTLMLLADGGFASVSTFDASVVRIAWRLHLGPGGCLDVVRVSGAYRGREAVSVTGSVMS